VLKISFEAQLALMCSELAVREERRCAAVQTPVNCHCQLEKHPVGDVEPVKFVMQYLTQAAAKLPSAGDDTRSSIQHTL